MSSDGYDDLWEHFNYFKNKYWTNCPYETYIVTETKECPYFKTIKKQGQWTQRLREALKEIDTEYVILMLEDFFLHKEVNQDKIDNILSSFDKDTSVYNLEMDYKNKGKGFRLRKNKEPYMNSCQPSIHNRLKLIERLDKDQTPWQWETSIVDSKYKFYINTEELIFDIGYYEDKKPWCIVQGKISNDMIELFKKEGLQLPKREKLEEPFLSIIIPYYKTLDLTKQLLDTLKPQLNDNVEVILIDDGCNEKELDNYNIKVIHKENGGVSKARNTGIDNAKGKYIAFIDSDDMIKPNYVEKILNKINEVDFDYCYISWEATGRNKGQYIIADEPNKENTCVWNCIYKRETIGTNRFPENKQIGEEIQFNKATRKGVKANILDILYIYNSGREDSLTVKYSKGEIKEDREDVIKTQVVIFRSFLSIIGGIETAVYNACCLLKDQYDVIFLYDTCDGKQLKRIQKEVKCIKNTGQKIECDVLLLYGFNPSSVFHIVKAKRVIQQICCDVKEVNYRYTPNEFTNEFCADSQASANQFMKSNPQYKCGVLHNLFNIQEPKRCLRIMTASRLSWEKGYDKMKAMAKRMNEKGIPFIWTVFTNDLPNEEIDGFIFMKPRLNVIDYMKGNDYGFQGSKSESWGNTVTEFLECGVPVIASEWASVREQIEDGKNGYILKQDLSNLDEVIDKMYSTDLRGFKYEPKYSIEEWKKIIGDLGEPKHDYKIEPTNGYEVMVIKPCYYTIENVQAKAGDILIIQNEQRLEKLVKEGYVKLL
jgi:glycosyltransferase involved in cell wall biosynthesis